MSAHPYSTHLALVGMAAVWGASWPWGRVVAQAMPPVAAACLRFALASVVLVFWLQRSGRLKHLRTLQARQWQGLLYASAIGILGYSIFFLYALQTVPAGRAAMVVALNPVLTLLFAVWLFREPVNSTMAVGVILAVTGALLALTGGSLSALDPRQSGAGELFLLGCAGTWVAYTLIGRKVLVSIDSLTTTTVTAVIGSAMLFVASLILEGPSAWGLMWAAPPAAWYSLVALSLCATALGYAWYLQGVKVLGAGAAAAYLALVPLFGMLFSNLLLGEAITASLLVGGVVAILGMGLMNLGRLFAVKKRG